MKLSAQHLFLLGTLCTLSFLIGYLCCIKFYIRKCIGGYVYPIVDSDEYEEQVAVALTRNATDDICREKLQYVVLEVGEPVDPRKKQVI